jgi:hypothetical protein
MKLARPLVTTALWMCAAAGVHAEVYDGVHALTHEMNRPDVVLQARTASLLGDPYGETVAEGALVYRSIADRSTLRAQGVERSHDRYHALDRWQFYRDTIPPQFYYAKFTLTQQALL